MTEILGDSHNFGKRVQLTNEGVYKPRSVYWEAMFLSAKSPVRMRIAKECEMAGLDSPFLLAPDLSFEIDGVSAGNVELLDLESLPFQFQLSTEQIRCIGGLLGLAFWFGLGDLHYENVMIGIKNDRMVCFPIDIECLFDQLTHLKQTLLIPSERVTAEKCGLARLWPILTELPPSAKIEILRVFALSINMYNRISRELLNLITESKDFSEHPVRVIVRDTSFYRESIKNHSFENLHKSEVEQLKRGDIPYYFRFPCDLNIYYWTSEEQFEKAEFNFDDFNMPTPIEISDMNTPKFIKLKTVLLSINQLAKQLELNSSLIQLNCVNVSYENENLVFKEINSELIISSNQ